MLAVRCYLCITGIAIHCDRIMFKTHQKSEQSMKSSDNVVQYHESNVHILIFVLSNVLFKGGGGVSNSFCMFSILLSVSHPL